MQLTKELVRNVLEKAKKRSDEAEVYAIVHDHFNVDVMNGSIESVDEVSDAGIAIRLIKDNKLGFSYSADIEEDAIEGAIESALECLSVFPPDQFNGFPEPKKQGTSLDLVDPEIQRTPVKDKVAIAVSMEKAAYEYDPKIKKTEKIAYHDSLTRSILANSKGIEIEYSRSASGIYADVIAEENSKMESGAWMSFSLHIKDLDPASIGHEAAKRAVSMLGAVQAKSGIAPIVLSPWAATILISSLTPALTAESVLKGKSLFSGALEKPIASHKFSLIDSGILKAGLASAPYDDEGVPTRETYLIKDGFLKSLLHDTYTAKKMKTEPTGNNYRASFKTMPAITPSNLYVRPGLKTQDDIIGGITRGFFVTTIMGAHTINPISGDFSIGFSGFLIENGKLTVPVRGMTLAGNVTTLLTHIENIGNDISFFPQNGNIGSPSLLISSLSVSGI